MIKRYFIPQELIEWSEMVSKGSVIADQSAFYVNNKIGLYCKNSMKMYYWKNPVKATNRLGYIAERGWSPKYFTEIVIEK